MARADRGCEDEWNGCEEEEREEEKMDEEKAEEVEGVKKEAG